MVIGILAVQGDFAEHKKTLEQLHIKTDLIRNRNDLKKTFSGIVLPGGESTTMIKLLNDTNMFSELKHLIGDRHLPTLATCAGLILLAKTIVNDQMIGLQTLPVSVQRNAFGRQIDSFSITANFTDLGQVPMVFIRAPYICSVDDPKVKILATVDKKIVGVQWNNQIGIAFHPELTDDLRVHEYFVDLVKKQKTN